MKPSNKNNFPIINNIWLILIITHTIGSILIATNKEYFNLILNLYLLAMSISFFVWYSNNRTKNILTIITLVITAIVLISACKGIYTSIIILKWICLQYSQYCFWCPHYTRLLTTNKYSVFTNFGWIDWLLYLIIFYCS